jgi:hypothetical protein
LAISSFDPLLEDILSVFQVRGTTSKRRTAARKAAPERERDAGAVFIYRALNSKANGDYFKRFQGRLVKSKSGAFYRPGGGTYHPVNAGRVSFQ